MLKLTRPVATLIVITLLNFTIVQSSSAGGAKNPWKNNPRANAPTAEATESLLHYFKSSCPSSYNAWTSRALADADALISILQHSKTDPACATLGSSLSKLNLMAQQLSNFEIMGNEENEEALGYQRRREELLLQLTQSQAVNDTDLVKLIQNDLRTLQLEFAELQGRMESQEDYNNKLKFGKALHGFIISADSIMKQAGQSGACLEKNPDILPAIASVAATAGSAFLPATYAFLAQAGSSLISSVVEYIRVNKLDKQISTFNITKLEVAMQCGLESMSEQWCAAKDGVRLATLTQEFLVKRSNPQGALWETIQIYQRDIPILKKFLNTVQAGALPTNTSANDRREAVLSRVEFIRSFESYGLALIAQNRSIFDNAGSSGGSAADILKERWGIKQSIINSLYSRANGIGNSPMFKVVSSRYFQFHLAGHRESDIPTQDDIVGGFYLSQFENLDPTNTSNRIAWPTANAQVSLSELQVRFLNLISKARDSVLRERSEIVNVDPLQVAYGYRTKDKRLTNLTPEISLQNVKRFINKRLTEKGQDFLLEDTLALLDTIDTQMKSVFEAPDRLAAKMISSQAVDIVTADLKLVEGFDFFQKRLESAAEDALLDLVIEYSQNPKRQGDANDVARFLATTDILNQLRDDNSSPSLPELKLRLEHSITITQTTLRSFTNLFDQSIRNVISYLNENAKREVRPSKGYWQTSYGQQHAQLCFRLLDVDVVPQKLREQKSLCEGAILISGYEGTKGAPEALKFIPGSFNRPHYERACVLRDYKRRVRIFENRVDGNILFKNAFNM